MNKNYIIVCILLMTSICTKLFAITNISHLSMQFQVSDILGKIIAGYYGTSLSLKYSFDNNNNNNNAFRLGVDAYYHNSDRISSSPSTNGTNIYNNEIEDKTSIQIKLQYIYNFFNTNTIIMPFLGIGPMATLYSDKINGNNNFYITNTTLTYANLSYKLGIEASFGLELFIVQQVSLISEYSTQIYYYYEDQLHYSGNRYISKIFGIDSGVRIGVSYYF